MDTFQLQVFCSLCYTLNYKKTADLHHITQPAVSYHIKMLEEEMNVKLLERSRYRTALTLAGREFLPYAELICEQEKLAKDRMKSISDGTFGRLTICGIQSYQSQIAQAVSHFSAEYPDVGVNTYILEGPELMHSYRFSEYDIYFGIESMLSTSAEYECVPFSYDYMELYYPLTVKPDPEDLSSLAGIPFLSVMERNRTLYDRVNALLRAYGLVPERIQYVSSVETILHLVNAGTGITILPGGYNRGRNFGNMLSFEILHPDALLPLMIASRRQTNQSVIHAFMDSAEECLKQQ